MSPFQGKVVEDAYRTHLGIINAFDIPDRRKKYERMMTWVYEEARSVIDHHGTLQLTHFLLDHMTSKSRRMMRGRRICLLAQV